MPMDHAVLHVRSMEYAHGLQLFYRAPSMELAIVRVRRGLP